MCAPPRHTREVQNARNAGNARRARVARRVLFREAMLFAIILVLALALGGGGWGYSRFGYASWSPLGLIVVLLLIVWATGNLRLV
jgi:fatty acid desaturase